MICSARWNDVVVSHRDGEAGLPQLDRADKGTVRVLSSSTDQLRQCRLAQTVFGGELLSGGRTTSGRLEGLLLGARRNAYRVPVN
jgi:hypothetical protein